MGALLDWLLLLSVPATLVGMVGWRLRRWMTRADTEAWIARQHRCTTELVNEFERACLCGDVDGSAHIADQLLVAIEAGEPMPKQLAPLNLERGELARIVRGYIES